MKHSNQPAYQLIVRNGRVALPGGSQKLDIGAREGKIVALKPQLPGTAKQEIDATDRLVFPGFIDAHTHMGIPIKDTTSADNFSSGTRAAAFGGITTVLDFTVQHKGQSLQESVAERLQKAQGVSHADFNLHVNVTDQPEKWLNQIPQLVAQGFFSFKTFSTYREVGMMVTWDQFRKIMQTVGGSGGLVMLHAEDNRTIEASTRKYVNAGKLAPIFHARSRPPEAEARAIESAARIAGELNAPLYIVHLSSRVGLEAALKAREQGVPIYLETCPQYLLLNEDKYLQENGYFFITTPPLRSPADQQALWEALQSGEIDVVGTDHCPFTRAQKEMGNRQFHRTPNGLPGVETLFPLLYTYGVAHGKITEGRLLSVLAENPARIFGMSHRKGRISVGMDADLVIWNPNEEKAISGKSQQGNADWSPYEGMTVLGEVETVILRGNVLIDRGKWCAAQPSGELISRQLPS